MKASERLRALWEESADNPDASLRLANATLYLADVVEAAERATETAFEPDARRAAAILRVESHTALSALNNALEEK